MANDKMQPSCRWAAYTLENQSRQPADLERSASQEHLVPVEDPQKTWDEYYERKKAQRLREAAILDHSMRSAGVTDETTLALDFVHFGSSRLDIDALVEQLAENYTVEVVQDVGQDVWRAKGTTRPYGINLGQEQHLAWVGFMADVSRSYACVFSTWEIEAPSLGKAFASEHIDGDA